MAARRRSYGHNVQRIAVISNTPNDPVRTLRRARLSGPSSTGRVLSSAYGEFGIRTIGEAKIGGKAKIGDHLVNTLAAVVAAERGTVLQRATSLPKPVDQEVPV